MPRDRLPVRAAVHGLGRKVGFFFLPPSLSAQCVCVREREGDGKSLAIWHFKKKKKKKKTGVGRASVVYELLCGSSHHHTGARGPTDGRTDVLTSL